MSQTQINELKPSENQSSEDQTSGDQTSGIQQGEVQTSEFQHVLDRILEFRNKRDWKQFHTPENLAKSIAIESGEILEHFQWGDEVDNEALKDEIADVLIYSFLLAESIGADIPTLMLDKVARNEKRFPVDAVKGNSGKGTRVE